MGTSIEVEAGLRKASGSIGEPGSTSSIRAGYADGRLSRVAAETFAALKSSTWWAFLVVVLAIGCVAYADTRAEAVSLGYLYLFPLSFRPIPLPSPFPHS